MTTDLYEDEPGDLDAADQDAEATMTALADLRPDGIGASARDADSLD